MDTDVSLVYRLLHKLLPILTYSVIGVINTFIDFSLFSTLCLAFKTSAWQANVVSYSTAVIFSFFANRRFTFRSASHSGSRIVDQGGRFLVVSLMGLIASSLITFFLSPTAGAIAAKAVAIPVTLGLGFTMTRIWVFPMDAVPAQLSSRD
jgi:putative flippase GtrA